jgi:hypothetical protein
MEDPLWMQGNGTTPAYTAKEDRAFVEDLFTEGVAVLATHLKVAQRAAGANMQVGVAGGICWVQGDDQANQGTYRCRETAAETLLTIDPEVGALSRYDKIVMQVNDPDAGGAAGSNSVLRVVKGTAGSPGVAPATPNSALHLATIGPIVVGTASITDVSGLIVDARVQARLRYEYVTSANIATDAITQAKMANNSVGTTELIDSSVTLAKMADASVGTAELVDNAVTKAKMADLSVGTNELEDDAVTAAKLADNAVHSANISNGTIINGDVSPVEPIWFYLPLGASWVAPSVGDALVYTRWGNLIFVSGGARSASGFSLIGTLPAGYRPPLSIAFPFSLRLGGGTPGCIIINSSGQVTWGGAGVAPTNDDLYFVAVFRSGA